MEIQNIKKERKNIVFYNKDTAILKHLNRQKNQGEYIKSLIEEDRKRNKKLNNIDSIINSPIFEEKINSIIEEKVKKEINKYIEIVNKCYNFLPKNFD